MGSAVRMLSRNGGDREGADIPARSQAPGADGSHGLTADDHATSTGTLGKAMEILDIICSSRDALRFTDILDRCDMPRGTLHRHLANLQREGLICQERDNAYQPGLRLLSLARHGWARNTFRKVCEPHLIQLHQETGETVHLGQLHGIDVVYLDKLESRQSVRMHSQVGNISPAFCTGIGKAMLAALPAKTCATLLPTIPFRAFTPSTLVTEHALAAELAEIRQTGLAHDREEHEADIRCVAAAIRDEYGEVAGGLSVTAPTYRLDAEKLARWEELVLRTKQNIEIDLATQLGPRQQN